MNLKPLFNPWWRVLLLPVLLGLASPLVLSGCDCPSDIEVLALARGVIAYSGKRPLLMEEAKELAQGVLDLSESRRAHMGIAQGLLDRLEQQDELIIQLKREVNDGYRRWWYPEEVPSSDVIYPEVEEA